LRTQRPLVLVKESTRPIVRLELDDSPVEKSAEPELAALGEVVLCRAPDKPAASAAEPSAKETSPAPDAEKSSAGQSGMRLLPAGSLSLVQAPPADNVSGKSESATGNDSQTPPAAAASPTPAPAIPAAAPAPADSAPTPTQFTEQAKEWRAANMSDSAGWSPVDFDLAAVRERLVLVLDRQQRERARL
jgi:hypothetical protein